MQGQGGRGMGIKRNPYAIKIDRGRNCYSCRGFGHLAWNCRNQRKIS